MNRVAVVAIVATLAGLAAGPVPARGEEGVPAPGPAGYGVTRSVQHTCRRGDTFATALDAGRVVESVDVVWADKAGDARARILIDGVTVARRFVGSLETETIDLGMSGSELVLKGDRGRFTV